MKTKIHLITLLVGFATAVPATAAVSLEITKPPVAGGTGAGPLQDPNAAQGQWFRQLTPQPGQPTVRSHEFHDNVPGHGGGFAGSNAIRGIVTTINGLLPGNWLQGTPITSFTVSATITNDTPNPDGPWLPGTNSHLENQNSSLPYVGTLYATMLTIEFALSDLSLQPASWTLPYTPQVPEIIAANEDASAWYCYNPTADPLNPGNYYVPAWDFGNILVGQQSSRLLNFTVNGSITNLDTRYGALEDSFLGGFDILANRTTSLKISEWVDVPAIDNGFPYPLPPFTSSNASVFHIPEPSTASLLGLLSVLALRRRR